MGEVYDEYKEVKTTDKLIQLARNSPQLPIGLVALVAIIGHGLYNLRKRNERLSLYLIHYRVAAQGTFLGCLTFGMAYTLFKDHVWKRIKKE